MCVNAPGKLDGERPVCLGRMSMRRGALLEKKKKERESQNVICIQYTEIFQGQLGVCQMVPG